MSSLTGCLGEIRAIDMCISKGWEVYLPFGNHQKYDLIVGTEQDSLHRIQVKATTEFIESKAGGKYRVDLCYGRSHARELYTKTQIDFFIVCILPVSAFYVIPVEAIKSRACYFYPHRDNPVGFYEKYRESWDLLK